MNKKHQSQSGWATCSEGVSSYGDVFGGTLWFRGEMFRTGPSAIIEMLESSHRSVVTVASGGSRRERSGMHTPTGRSEQWLSL